MNTESSRLDSLLENIGVLEPGMWDNAAAGVIGDWYAVVNDEGIIAYFGKQSDAYRFRLAEINRVLNG